MRLDYALNKLFINLSIKIKKRIIIYYLVVVSIMILYLILDCCELNYDFFLTLKYLLLRIFFEIIILKNLIEIINYYIQDTYILKFKDNNFNIYLLLKYVLFILICINIYILISDLGKFIEILVNCIATIIYSLVKIKNFNFFNSLSKKFLSIKDNNKSPKGPNDSNFFPFDSTKKKVHKDISKKASEMKEKILNIQNLPRTNDVTAKDFVSHRNWEQSIVIEKRSELSIPQQLERIKFESKAYKNQEKKFKDIINDINNEKENFFPTESKGLFEDYLKVIDQLNKNLNLMKKNISRKKS
jgi:hypothetical protein